MLIYKDLYRHFLYCENGIKENLVKDDNSVIEDPKIISQNNINSEMHFESNTAVEKNLERIMNFRYKDKKLNELLEYQNYIAEFAKGLSGMSSDILPHLYRWGSMSQCYLDLNGKWKCIYYKNYRNAIININTTKTKNTTKQGINRLYSCCERKLLTVLKNDNHKFKMWVAIPPCDLCSEAFRYLRTVNRNYRYKLIVPKFWSYIAYNEFKNYFLL